MTSDAAMFGIVVSALDVIADVEWNVVPLTTISVKRTDTDRVNEGYPNDMFLPPHDLRMGPATYMHL